MLRDQTNYKLININIDNDIISRITKFCSILGETLTKKEKEIFTTFQ